MRDSINSAMKEAMKSGDKTRLGTLRLINAAIKDKDIEARGNGKEAISPDDILQLLQKMIKQRQESASIYEQNGRAELAQQEHDEIATIQSFLPRQLEESEVKEIVTTIISELNAVSIKDMGRVIAALKERYAGQMDFAKASGIVKAALS